MVLSEEKNPASAILIRVLRLQSSGSDGIVIHCLFFANHIGVEIRKSLEPVFTDQFILETFQMFFIADMSAFLHW